jgi:HSP20 family protein
MSDDLIRLMQSLFLPAAEGCREASWHPSLDVYRTPHGWLLKFDLAGVRPEDISLSVAGTRLIVRGSRRDWCADEGWCHYLMEIAYSHFERSLELPCNLDHARIATDYRDGMLLVDIRTEEAHS